MEQGVSSLLWVTLEMTQLFSGVVSIRFALI